jgi:hypothetical protein
MLAMSAAVLVVPAAVVLAFFHLLVRPMGRLVAIGTALASVLGLDPA